MTEAPGPGQLLVEVKAAGLNRADLTASGDDPAAAPGRELAGVVAALGDTVDGFSVGDRVMGRGAGFNAEALVDSRLALRVPDGLSDEEAAALPVALSTMHDALVTHGRMKQGHRVLMHAASSGVGVTGVQLAAAFGASTVFATSRSSDKFDIIADHLGHLDCELVPIDTSTQVFQDVATNVDLIVDNVGASVLEGNIIAAAIKGRIVQVGRLGGRDGRIDLDELARKRIELIGVTFRTRTPDEVAEIFQRVNEDVGDRLEAFKPRIAATFALADISEAFNELARNHHVGKIVVVP
jgi:NADPH:quinone reductase